LATAYRRTIHDRKNNYHCFVTVVILSRYTGLYSESRLFITLPWNSEQILAYHVMLHHSSNLGTTGVRTLVSNFLCVVICAMKTAYWLSVDSQHYIIYCNFPHH